MKWVMFFLARAFYTVYCFYRLLSEIFDLTGRYVPQIECFAIEYNQKLRTKNLTLDNDYIKRKVERIEKEDDWTYYRLTIFNYGKRLPNVIVFVPSGFICLILSPVYCFFLSDYIDAGKAFVIVAISSLVLGAISIKLLPKKKMFFWFVKFEMQESNRMLWHFISVLIIAMSICCFGLGLKLILYK